MSSGCRRIIATTDAQKLLDVYARAITKEGKSVEIFASSQVSSTPTTAAAATWVEAPI